MKFYKPLYSIIVIVIQLIFSIVNYLEFLAWGRSNPELNGVINRFFDGTTIFLFVLIIGFYEMLLKSSWFKTTVRIIIVCIVLGLEFSGLIPIDDFYSGVFNTAWFLAAICIVLILIRIGKLGIEKKNYRKSNRA